MRDQAEQALRLAYVTPAEAREQATVLQASALAVKNWPAASIASRALGVASLQLGDIASAVQHHGTAVRTARRSHSVQLVGQARIGLAGALALRGRTGQALREISRAIDDLDGAEAARARAQRAAILQEIGRVDDALSDLRVALPALRRHGDVQWQFGALSNRSALYASKRAFSAAEADLETARALCREHDLGLSAAYAEQNLGCVKAQRGDVTAALRHFQLAETEYQSRGVTEGSLLVDRAELLFTVRLVDEARSTAEAAVAAFQEHDRGIHVPEAQLLLASVALVQQDSTTASAAAAAALHGFRRLGRSSWAAMARYAQLQAMLAHRPGTVTAVQLRRSADELSVAGWRVHALEARVLAADTALKRGKMTQARQDLAIASRARSYGPADARARAWLAEALLRRADGRDRAAGTAVAAGLRVVEQHRATLGATELRAHVSVHRGELARLGLRMALEGGNARRVLSWAERGRANAALMRPAHPPEDEVLAHHLADLRTTVAELDEAMHDGEPTVELERRQVRLERAVADHCRQFPGSAGTTSATIRDSGELAADLGAAALVEFVEQDGVLSAVTLLDGRARLHTLGSVEAVQRSMGQVAFALHRLADRRRSTASVSAAGAALTKSRNDLDALLLQPLAALLRDRQLVIVPTASLQSLPWSLLPLCAGRPVTVAPSATLWNEAVHRREQPMQEVPERVVVVAGPGLPGARQEAEAVARLHPTADLLVGADAAAARVTLALDGAALVHIAAHGRLRSDNPQFSALVLADGPYTVYDLERLAVAPRHVVLAACDTGRTVTVAGQEILGLTAALLAQGTATLIAPVVPVPDAETVELMLAYHGHLLQGRPAAEALALAQHENASADPVARVAAAGFVCLGDGTRSTTPRAVPEDAEALRRSTQGHPTQSPLTPSPTDVPSRW